MQLNSPVSGGNRSDDLIGKVIIVTKVIGEEEVQTKDYGITTAVRANVRILGGFSGEEDLTTDGEEYLFFWQVVKAQLQESEIPIAGRIVKKGRAYVLDALDDETLNQVQVILDSEEGGY